jgi:hypothetical protein
MLLLPTELAETQENAPVLPQDFAVYVIYYIGAYAK